MTDQFDKELSQKRIQTRRVIAELVERLNENASTRQLQTTLPEKAAEFNLPADLEFLEQLASPNPTPAGGSAAAYAGACAAALIIKVAKITAGNPKYNSVKPRMEKIGQETEPLMRDLYLAVGEDNHAYQQFLVAHKLPASTEEERRLQQDELQKARVKTIRIPLQVAQKCLETMNLAVGCIQEGGFLTICDSLTAGLLAESALRASLNNAQFNLRDSLDEEFNVHVQESISNLIEQMTSRSLLIHEAYQFRIGTKMK